MSRLLNWIFTINVIPLLLLSSGGCETTYDNAVNPENPSNGTAFTGLGFQDVTFGNFEVAYTGRTYDGSSTTFSYSVTGPDKSMNFRLGWSVSECTLAPVSWTPADGVIGSNHCCINPGLEWTIASGGSRSYVTHYFSYSFAGDIPEAIVPVSMECNGRVLVSEIQGPGIPEYLIAGRVFQDANANALLDADETFVQDVTISLIRDGSLVSSTTSDAAGNYEFNVPCGTYVVMLDTTTLTGTEKTYFIATTPLFFETQVGPDSPENNFGFDVHSEKLIEDLGSQALPTTGLEAKYWKKEFHHGGFDYTEDELLAFLESIEELALEDPFVFPDDDQERLDYVYEILRKPVRTDFEDFERELLTLELNYVAGKGIDLSTELVLIGWGESLYNDSSQSNPKAGMTEATTILDATAVYRGINSNKSTGGGGTQ